MFLNFNYLFALVLVLTLHEYAHAWTANRLGDATPERQGRLSLNPLRHLDLLGTVMLFIAGIGWGKPVQINARNFKNPGRDEALTAAAGPTMNLFIALAAAIFVNYAPQYFFSAFFDAVLDLSLVLFLFNLLPFAPLDGSKFALLAIPRMKREKYRDFMAKSTPYFLAFVVVDLYFIGNIFGFSIVWTIISTIFFWLKTAILVVV